MVKIVAEIGCNHKGSLDIAKEMISVAARVCKVDVVKFQKRNNKELLSPEQYNAPHPVPENSYGPTYGAHREALEFTAEQHAELMEYGKVEGIDVCTSVWDMTSAREIAQLKPALIKIPSATNLHWELQGWLCENYAGEIHVSTGMTTPEEIESIVRFYEDRGRAKDMVLYNCTSGYPVDFQDICLLEITKLRAKYADRVNHRLLGPPLGHRGRRGGAGARRGVGGASLHARPHLEGHRPRRQPGAGRHAPPRA